MEGGREGKGWREGEGEKGGGRVGIVYMIPHLYPLQSTDAADYRLQRREPDGCNPDDCDYFLGVDTNSGNSSYLDFYLVGRATGWVAVGFSPTANMVSGHPLPC